MNLPAGKPRHFRRARGAAALVQAAASVVLVCSNLQPLRGQGPGEARTDLAFEVASVKPNASGGVRVTIGMQPGGRFVATNVPLRLLIRHAYQLQEQQLVGGPDWIDSARFDIVAKAEGTHSPTLSGTAAPFQLMLRALLAERFNLIVHREARELPIYALVPVRSDGRLGPQLRPSATRCEPVSPTPDDRPACGITGGLARLSGERVTMTQLAASLSLQVTRVVVNRTGLTGDYDFELEWTPEQLPPRALGTPADQPVRINGADVDPNGPGLFTALREQLGLELDAQRGSVDVVAIDGVEAPTPD